MLLAFMKKLLQSRRVLLAWFSALNALMVQHVQSVLLQELFGLPELQIVRIYFKYNYI